MLESLLPSLKILGSIAGQAGPSRLNVLDVPTPYNEDPEVARGWRILVAIHRGDHLYIRNFNGVANVRVPSIQPTSPQMTLRLGPTWYCRLDGHEMNLGPKQAELVLSALIACQETLDGAAKTQGIPEHPSLHYWRNLLAEVMRCLGQGENTSCES